MHMENTEEKIRALLRQGAEYEKLDYKRTFDINSTHEVVEITKDIAAMLSSGGGTLLIGADDKGVAVPDFTDALATEFDEAKLRSKLKKFISEPLTIIALSTKVDGVNHALIECGEYADGFVILKADGQYQHNGKSKEIFRKGDVFVRHGSASEKWEQHDIARIIHSQVSKQKIEWLKDAELILSRVGSQAPAEIETKTRLKEVIKPLKQAIADDNLNISDLKLVIDEICLTAIKAVLSDSEAVFKVALDSLASCYSLGFDPKGNWRLNGNFNPADLWSEILIRLPIIGGVCIEEKRYRLAKLLVLQKVPGDDGRHYPNWYRHAFTMATRSRRLPHGSNGEKRSFLSATTSIFQNDIQYKNALNWDTEEGLTYIVRFDYFAALVALDDIQQISTRAFYPSFGLYDKSRVEQMLVDILLDEEVQKTLFKSSPENLAYIIQQIDELAERESDYYWDRGDWKYGLAQFMSAAKEFN